MTLSRVLGATIAAIVVALSGACSEPDREALRFGLAAGPVTLDPRLATDAASSRINRLLYQRLVDFDHRFRPVPALASWQRLSATRYRFTLASAQFVDGTPVRAQDVKHTYESVLDPATGSPHRGSLSMISRIEVNGPDVVDFVLSEPDLLFPGRLVIGILPAEALARGHRFGRDPIGSGAFEFSSWPDETRLRIRRRADGQLVEFVQVPDPTVRVLKLVRAEIDMLQGDLPWELREWLAQRQDVNVQVARGTTFAYLGFNLEDPTVGDPRVRRAIGHAIDRHAVVRHLLGNAARLASAILVPEHWAGNPSLPPVSHDPVKARRLLRAAGYRAGEGPKIVYKTSSDPQRIRLATLLQAQLARAGIAVELKTYDWGTFYGDIKAGAFQMYSLQWVGAKMPDIFRYTMHSASVPPAGANRGRYSSARADALIERAEAAQTREEQIRWYRALQAHLLDELPYVPLWYEDQVYAARVDVTGYTVSQDGNYDGLTTVRRKD